MPRYTLAHRAESERVLRALEEQRLDDVCLAADGTVKPFGTFMPVDLDYWRDYLEVVVRQNEHVLRFMQATLAAVSRCGVDRPADLPQVERALVDRLERLVMWELREVNPLPDVFEGSDGHLEMLRWKPTLPWEGSPSR